MLNLKFTLLFIFLITIQTFGQNPTAQITDVRKKDFRGVRAIINEKTLLTEGFYTFYVGEKVNSKEANFVLTIFDNDLKLISQSEILMDKKSEIQSSSYNGKDFLFIFQGSKLENNNTIRFTGGKTVTYVVIDRNGKIVATKGLELNTKLAFEQGTEVLAADNGFYFVKLIKEKKLGYSIEKVDRNLNVIWEKRFLPEDKGRVALEFLYTTESQLLIVQTFWPSAFSRKHEMSLFALNDADGKENFSFPLFDEANNYVPSSFYIEKDGSIISSGMYFEGKKIDYGNSDGLFFLRLSKNGQKEVLTTSSWDSGLQKHLKSDKRGLVIGSKPKVMFHNTVKADDGTYQVIGETFTINYQTGLAKFTESPKRVIGDQFGTDRASLGFRIEDFVIFNFNANGEIVNFHKIEKEHTTLHVYNPYKTFGALRLAWFLRYYGYFDYAFTTNKKDSEQQIIVTWNFLKNKPFFGMFKIDNNEPSAMVKIEVEKRIARLYNLREDDFVGIMKAKPGFVGIYYYEPKEKSIYIYLEPIPDSF
jgi:hypothetical protein